MSLWRHRHLIEDEVAGELAPAARMRLREHLRRCADCRAYYDRLARVAQVVAPETTSSRELARLRAALGPEQQVAFSRRQAPTARWLWWSPLVLAPICVLLFALSRPFDGLRSSGGDPPPHGAERAANEGEANLPEGEVNWRGAEDEAPSELGLLVYASRRVDGGATGVRLVADLPGSGEGSVSLGDYIQFSVRGLRAAAYVTVVGLDEAGEVHIYAPRPDKPGVPVAKGTRPRMVGPSIDLSVKHRAGLLRLFAIVTPEPTNPGDLAAAAKRAGFSGELQVPGKQVTGRLAITP